MYSQMMGNIIFFLFTLVSGCFCIPALNDVIANYKNFSMSNLLEPHLINGTPAPISSHPYMVAITMERLVKDFLCGGSLISQRTVLTAAHCLDGVVHSDGTLYKSLRAVVGTDRWESEGTRYKLKRNITHPHYVASLVKNDITLLITTTSVELSDTVQLISLNYNYIEAGVKCKVAGWGLTSISGPISRLLREITIYTISDQQCLQAMENLDSRDRSYSVDPQLEICTFHSAGLGTCLHDSGSPLVDVEDHQQIGIVSWGHPCAIGVPDVFTRISTYKEFIEASLVE